MRVSAAHAVAASVATIEVNWYDAYEREQKRTMYNIMYDILCILYDTKR